MNEKSSYCVNSSLVTFPDRKQTSYKSFWDYLKGFHSFVRITLILGICRMQYFPEIISKISKGLDEQIDT